MLKRYLFILFLVMGVIQLTHSQTITGVINSYARVTSIVGNTISFDNVSLAPSVLLADAFGVGKKVLIIQMKGASINTSNNSSFGSLVNLNNTGNYEILEITGFSVSSIQISGINKSYNTAEAVQIVSFPQFNDVTVSGTVTATAWDRTLGRGGVVAFEVLNNLILDGNVNVSNQGFAGGTPNTTNAAGCNNNYTYVSASYDAVAGQYHAGKGESVVDYVANGISGQEFARGASLNGGGGGNSHNGGGGGGSNYTAGGNGGFGWLGAGACAGTNIASGVGGYALNYSPATDKIFMGGGGGAGQQNNNVASRGGNGGGIILIRAKQLTSNCLGTYGFYANGENAPHSTGNDGGGGGGAGGTIFLEIYNYSLGCDIQVQANGGNGGNVNNATVHGAGGGGGVGIVLLINNPPIQLNINSTSGIAGLDCNMSSCTSTGGNGASAVTPYQIGWYATGDVNALPITLISFKAEWINEKVKIHWKTATEYNTQYFEVEKSKDAQSLEILGRLDALGFSEKEQNYSTYDESPYKGGTYYRLKAVDFDGSFQYSNWVFLRDENEFTFQIFPNPVSEKLSIIDESNSNLPQRVNIYDLKGQLLYHDNFVNETLIDVSGYKSGSYILRIISTNKIINKKIIIL